MNEDRLAFFGIDTYADAVVQVHHPYSIDYLCQYCGNRITDIDYRASSGQILTFDGDDFYEGSKAIMVGPEWPESFRILGEPPLIRSDIVLAIQAAGLSGYTPHLVSLVRHDQNQYAKIMPDYYQLEIHGHVDIDLEEADIQVCTGCCSRLPSCRDSGYELYLPLLETWDGSDFVRIGNYRHGKTFCTRRFVDLFIASGWSDFSFGEYIPGFGASVGAGKEWFETTRQWTESQLHKLQKE